MTTKEEELQCFLHTNYPKETSQTENKIDTKGAQKALTQLHFSDAAQKIILDPKSFNKEANGLVSISSSNELLMQVHKSLSFLIDSLALTISALDVIRQKLSLEVEKFKAENELANQIDTLKVQIESSIITEKFLRESQEDLQKDTLSFKNNIERNQMNYEKTIEKLEKTNLDHQRINEILTLQLAELKNKKTTLNGELEKTKSLATILQKTVKTLSETVISNSQQRETFQKKLDAFLQNEEKSFTDFIERISKTEDELISDKSQLEHGVKRHEQVMERRAELIIRLERIDQLIPVDSSTRTKIIDQLIPTEPSMRDQKLSNAGALGVIGIMGNIKPNNTRSFFHQSRQSNTLTK
ncbi:hypothetical protein [Legionella sp.]|uniref:hypothetical protein n=1 Tax=Legionella sp. TaxID=459 RepID=UPI003CB0F469